MNIKEIFFPEESRTLKGKRWANVAFRSIHLCSMAIYTGSLFRVNGTPDMGAYLITALSGLAIILMDLYSNGKWIFQNRGFFILVKVLALGILHHLGTWNRWEPFVIIVFSSFVSHGRADFRYYSIFHGKRI
jgi:hypothetical protein